MKTLKEAKVGTTVKVVKLTGEGAVKRRIMDMGITKGVEIYVRKVAPLGDPVEVTVRGYELSLRKNDAEIIEIAQAKIKVVITVGSEQNLKGEELWKKKSELPSRATRTAAKPRCSTL